MPYRTAPAATPQICGRINLDLPSYYEDRSCRFHHGHDGLHKTEFWWFCDHMVQTPELCGCVYNALSQK